MELLLHSETRRQVEAFLHNPAHAVLIEGEPGSGKGALSTHLVTQALNLDPDKLPKYAYFLKIEPVNGSISIETIRGIQDFVKLKTTGKNTLRRAIIIENAQVMTVEAQNAFLKLLEEPPADTLIVLTAAPNQTLLPTIYSRVQKLQLKTIDKQAVLDYFGNKGNNNAEPAYYMSNGRIGLMQALLEEDADHPLVEQISRVKSLLAMSTYERMTAVDSIAKDKASLPDLLAAFQRVFHAVLTQATEKDQTSQVKKAHSALKHISWVETQMRRNPNPKLLLSDLLLNI